MLWILIVLVLIIEICEICDAIDICGIFEIVWNLWLLKVGFMQQEYIGISPFYVHFEKKHMFYTDDFFHARVMDPPSARAPGVHYRTNLFSPVTLRPQGSRQNIVTSFLFLTLCFSNNRSIL